MNIYSGWGMHEYWLSTDVNTHHTPLQELMMQLEFITVIIVYTCYVMASVCHSSQMEVGDVFGELVLSTVTPNSGHQAPEASA